MLIAWSNATTAIADPLDHIPTLPLKIEQRIPHDPTVFTQGLVISGKTLYESSGLYRNSRLLSRSLTSMTPLREIAVPRAWFAEGIAILGDSIYQLTWNEGVARQYRRADLTPLHDFHYSGEGWGLTSDGASLIMSNGSDRLVWRDPRDFSIRRQLIVHAGERTLERINELEWMDGWILANIWTTDWIVAIDPDSGEVCWKIDLHGFLSDDERRIADVANGIAWEPETRRLWVTGKLWPWLFELSADWPRIQRRGK